MATPTRALLGEDVQELARRPDGRIGETRVEEVAVHTDDGVDVLLPGERDKIVVAAVAVMDGTFLGSSTVRAWRWMRATYSIALLCSM